MIYNYSQQGFGAPSRQGTWSSFSDLGLTGLMPAAALLYRQGHVREADESYCIMLDKQKLYMQDSHPRNMAALRTLVERSKVAIGLPDTKELDWDEQSKPELGVKIVTDLGKDFIGEGHNEVRSDTGQLARNWVKGYQVIDTDKTKAVHGWIGGEKFELKGASFEIQTPKAAVAVSSIDGKAIGASRNVLITAIARVVASDGGGRMPLLSEPVKGIVFIKGPAGLKLVPLSGDGSKLESIETPYLDSGYIVKLPAQRGTHWFMLTDAD
jgi:hypothetical protein